MTKSAFDDSECRRAIQVAADAHTVARDVSRAAADTATAKAVELNRAEAFLATKRQKVEQAKNAFNVDRGECRTRLEVWFKGKSTGTEPNTAGQPELLQAIATATNEADIAEEMRSRLASESDIAQRAAHDAAKALKEAADIVRIATDELDAEYAMWHFAQGSLLIEGLRKRSIGDALNRPIGTAGQKVSTKVRQALDVAVTLRNDLNTPVNELRSYA